MAGYPKPRIWKPNYPQKYKGDPTNIVSRSSWETKFMNWCDSNVNVLSWCSEEIIIPYISPVDEKPHRYFLDFAICVRKKDGTIKKYLVEVKPNSQTVPPIKGNKREKTFLAEVKTYAVNSAKWEAAKKFASKKGYEFIIITEKHLF
jgi:hypothetical protein